MEKEIKVGDKVRVREDAPKIYTEGWSCDWLHAHSNVRKTEGDSAEIELDCYALVIPLKYLVKVDAEAKEAKYKVGNWVMISGVFNPQLNGMIGWISRIDEDGNKVSFQDGRFAIVEDKYLTLITQPTEQTEAEEDARIRQMETELDEFRKAKLDRMLHPEKPTFEVTIDNVAMNWQRYEADLAKEVALKVANKYNGPKEAAEYAVSVAKAVAEGLKRK